MSPGAGQDAAADAGLHRLLPRQIRAAAAGAAQAEDVHTAARLVTIREAFKKNEKSVSNVTLQEGDLERLYVTKKP